MFDALSFTRIPATDAPVIVTPTISASVLPALEPDVGKLIAEALIVLLDATCTDPDSEESNIPSYFAVSFTSAKPVIVLLLNVNGDADEYDKLWKIPLLLASIVFPEITCDEAAPGLAL